MSGRVRGDGLFPPAAYARDDEAPDDHFYLPPRKVVHIDEHAIARLGASTRRCCRPESACST